MSNATAVPRKGMQQVMGALLVIITGLAFTISSAKALTPTRAEQGAQFWGQVNSDGTKFACWKGFTANAIGDYGARPWLRALDTAKTSGCEQLRGNVGFNLYWMTDLTNADSRRALRVATDGSDRLDGKLGGNICRMDDPAGHGSKLYVTSNPNDKSCQVRVAVYRGQDRRPVVGFGQPIQQQQRQASVTTSDREEVIVTAPQTTKKVVKKATSKQVATAAVAVQPAEISWRDISEAGLVMIFLLALLCFLVGLAIGMRNRNARPQPAPRVDRPDPPPPAPAAGAAAQA